MKVSQNRLREAVTHVLASGTVTITEYAKAKSISDAYACVILKQAAERGLLSVEKPKRAFGEPGKPYVYSVVTGASAPDEDDDDDVVPEHNGTENTEVKVNLRGVTTTSRVAAYLSRQKVGAQFTVEAIHRQLSRLAEPPTKAAVYQGVQKFLKAGCVERTGAVKKCRDGSTEAYFRIVRAVPYEKPATNRRVRRTKATLPEALAQVQTPQAAPAGDVLGIAAQLTSLKDRKVQLEQDHEDLLAELESVNTALREARALLLDI